MENDTSLYTVNHFPSWLHASCYFVIGTLAICGNAINILVIPRLTAFPESAKVLVTVLSMCDFLVGITLVVTAPSAWVDRWILGDGLCNLFAISMFFSAGGGGSVLLLLNADRFYAISKPFVHVRLVTKTKVSIVCGVALSTWFLSAFLYGSDESFLDNTCYSWIYRKCFMKLIELEGFYAILLSFVLYSQCFAIVLIYIKIWQISGKHSKRIANHSFSMAGNSTTAATTDYHVTEVGTGIKVKISGSDSKAIRTTLLVTGAYLGSWIPYSTSIVLELLGIEIPPEFHAFCSLAVVCNSWWNTVVYSICNRNFREKAKRLFNGCFDRKS